ncbi:aminoglycoside phosphotransferase family protein [Micromonospora yangpuensis]|uniref:aminoglycoside phosphotransferase family protein n=1 Tax=Micromonospora yangpuensis TaxID=683228 RepID=UPI001FD2DA22|nr:aminoglycoside phosphotransferase family protein [Micromonospora yangpuensis]
MNVVRRHGDVVHRPASPAAPAIHRLLRHLHDHGFHGAPEPRGFDIEGNEILTFLDGEVPDVITPELRTPEFCRAYGPDVGVEVVDVVPGRLQALIDFMRDQASHGNAAFRQHIVAGHADLYEADIRYVRTHRDMLRAAFKEDRPVR